MALEGSISVNAHSIHLLGQCQSLEESANSNITYLEGRTMATYICDRGYGIEEGDGIRTCDGTKWSGEAPICSGLFKTM